MEPLFQGLCNSYFPLCLSGFEFLGIHAKTRFQQTSGNFTKKRKLRIIKEVEAKDIGGMWMEPNFLRNFFFFFSFCGFRRDSNSHAYDQYLSKSWRRLSWVSFTRVMVFIFHLPTLDCASKKRFFDRHLWFFTLVSSNLGYF